MDRRLNELRIDGTKSWFLNGERHREDGPAVEFAGGIREYWYKGERIPEEIFLSKEFQVKIIMDA